MKNMATSSASRLAGALITVAIGVAPACSIRDEIVNLRADGDLAKATIQRELGVTAHVGMRIEKRTGGPGVLVTVTIDDIPAMDARDLKGKVDAIVRRSFKRSVSRVDLVL